MQKVDFHLHSNLSDCDMCISDLVKYAKINNISMLDITDHDYIDCYDNLSDDKIDIFSGIEFSTSYK